MGDILNPVPGVTYRSEQQAGHFLRCGAWVDDTLGGALRKTAARYPDRPAYITDEGSLSYAELDERSECLAAALLDLGLAPGDRAIFQMGTTLETAVALMASYKAGVVPVCAIPQYRSAEIGKLIEISQARAYVVQADSSQFDLAGFAHEMMAQYPVVRHLVVARGTGAEPGHALEDLMSRWAAPAARERLKQVAIGPRDVLSFQLSGGSTGLPKIIPRFHGEYMGHAAGWSRRYAIDSSSRVIWSLSLMHNAGQVYALVPTVLLGVTTVLMPRVDIVRMLELIEQHRVTHGLSIGPIAPQLIAYPHIARHDLSSLRLFATMSRADLLETHLGVPCSNLYGITEGLLLGAGADDPAFVRHHTQGASGCEQDEIKVLEPGTDRPVAAGAMGELCFRGPSSLTGYYGDEAATRDTLTSDGFVRSGDMVTEHQVDGRSWYAFEGRLRDNINRGGEKIGCEEIEGHISQHPAVSDTKLVAMPDPIYGERACAYLVLRPGHRAPDVHELAEFLLGRGLAKFKCPERVEIVEEFPTTRVGKVDKVALRKLIAERLQAEAAGGGRPGVESPAAGSPAAGSPGA